MKKELAILALIGITYLLTLQDAPLKKINETIRGELVQIQGVIQKCQVTDHLTIINLTDETGNIKTVFFAKENCWNGMKAEIKGRIDEYKGEKELKGVKIKFLN